MAEDRRAFPLAQLFCGTLLALNNPSPVLADVPAVISGGADVSGHQYSWTVENRSASAAVEVGFPHYRASLFFAPQAWTTDCTNQVGIGVKDAPGVCTARAASPREGIAPGRSAVFHMQIAPAGARRLPGAVSLRFADGSRATVTGVELPAREPVGDKYVSLIGLGLVFVAWVAYQAVRRRRAARAAGERPSAQST